MTNKKNGTLYVGVTSNLEKRVGEHKTWFYWWFTKKYWCTQLVWYQESHCIEDAIAYEKKIKKWERLWKI